MPGTAGSEISPVATDRRYNRRAIASRSSCVGSTCLWGRLFIRSLLHDRDRFCWTPILDNQLTAAENARACRRALQLPTIGNTTLRRAALPRSTADNRITAFIETSN